MEVNWKDFILRTAGVRETIAVFFFILILGGMYMLNSTINGSIRELAKDTKGLSDNVLLLKAKVDNIEGDVSSFKGDLNLLKNRLTELEIQQKVLKENAMSKAVTKNDTEGDINYYIQNATISSDDVDPMSIQNQVAKNNQKKK